VNASGAALSGGNARDCKNDLLLFVQIFIAMRKQTYQRVRLQRRSRMRCVVNAYDNLLRRLVRHEIQLNGVYFRLAAPFCDVSRALVESHV